MPGSRCVYTALMRRAFKRVFHKYGDVFFYCCCYVQTFGACGYMEVVRWWQVACVSIKSGSCLVLSAPELFSECIFTHLAKFKVMFNNDHNTLAYESIFIVCWKVICINSSEKNNTIIYTRNSGLAPTIPLYTTKNVFCYFRSEP